MMVDYLVVGAGLTGASIGRVLADAGREVLVLERRSHVSGNVHDFNHESGIRIHSYGPHYFRTNSERIWRFVNRFDVFFPCHAVVMSAVDGHLVNWPVTAEYIRSTVGEDWRPEFTGTATNFEEASLSLMPRTIYETLVRGYTEKQWGVSASSLSPNLARRFEVRRNNDPRLSCSRWQGIPTSGYARFVQELLRGIPVILNCDYLAARQSFSARKRVIYTGPIDEFFDFELGRLAYRAQHREHRYYPDQEFHQPVVQLNNPSRSAGAHIRTIEWKPIMPMDAAERVRGTVVTMEMPFTPWCPTDYEYPFPDDRNRRLYRMYRERANSLPNTVIAGRLGEYRYYDMDQAIARALIIGRRLLDGSSVHESV